MKAYLPKTYAKAVTELTVSGKNPKAVVQSLVRSLRKRKALLLLPRILREVQTLVSQEGKETVSVRLARAADAQTSKHIGGLVKHRYGASPVSFHSDPSLIGGFSMQHGDDVTDYSLKTLLEQLHSSIDTKIV